MKKRSFLLIEVLIAMGLVALTLIPLFSFPFKMTKKEIEILKKIELVQLEEKAFSDLFLQIPLLIDKKSFELLEDEIQVGPYHFDLDKRYSYEGKMSLSLDKSKKPEAKNVALLKADLYLISLDTGKIESEKKEWAFTVKQGIIK